WREIPRKALRQVSPTSVILAEAVLYAWAKARERGLSVLQIAQSEAAHLSFPPGHPRHGILYVGHPVKPDLYYVTAEFHRVTFEHKFSEAVHLLTCLGATKMKVECIRGWGR